MKHMEAHSIHMITTSTAGGDYLWTILCSQTAIGRHRDRAIRGRSRTSDFRPGLTLRIPLVSFQLQGLRCTALMIIPRGNRAARSPRKGSEGPECSTDRATSVTMLSNGRARRAACRCSPKSRVGRRWMGATFDRSYRRSLFERATTFCLLWMTAAHESTPSTGGRTLQQHPAVY
jgi:hypothetical protein